MVVVADSGVEMAVTMEDVVQWTMGNGAVGSVDRLNMLLLPDLVAEGVNLSAIGPDSICSDDLLAKMIAKAEDVVGTKWER